MITSEDLEAMGYYKEVDMQKSPQDMVEDYYYKAGIKPDWATCQSLVLEEFLEWKQEAYEMLKCGHNRYDSKEELKELADLAYVVFGYAHSRGWDLMEAFRRVHQNNMERMTQDDGTIKRREDGKILRNPNTPKVELGDLV
jgi:predicted HAD superfamily Cof-like phosphohydrolase